MRTQCASCKKGGGWRVEQARELFDYLCTLL
jgi:hypothetical protein